MGCALALPLLASLVAAADADLRLDFRAESRTSAVAAEGMSPYDREALLARPGAALVLDVVPLRLTAGYTATIWTSDVEASPSPLVTQDAQLRIESYNSSAWRAGAAVSAARGWTDPLADPVAALAQQGPSQSPSLEPIEFEAIRAAADGTFPLDRRTTLGVEAYAGRSGAVSLADRATYPFQNAATAQVYTAHLLSHRSTLRLTAAATATRTELASGNEDSGWATGTARWRVRMTRALDCWAGAGAGVSRRDLPGAAPELRAHPVGEIGTAYQLDRLSTELSAQTVPFTDRFSGDVVLMYQGSGMLRWRQSARLSFGATASGGTTQSGDTALAALDARAIYALAERTFAEAGVVGRWQRERGTGAPSFSEIGLVVGFRWEAAARPASASAAPDVR